MLTHKKGVLQEISPTAIVEVVASALIIWFAWKSKPKV
jgi:hypothetical protein